MGGWDPLILQLQLKVTPCAWWISKVPELFGPESVTASNRTLETGASGTAQKIPGALAVVAELAVTLLKVMWSQ